MWFQPDEVDNLGTYEATSIKVAMSDLMLQDNDIS